MLHGCFNPDCHAELRYLRSGRIVREVRNNAAGLKVEHFWLCGDCHRTLDFAFADDGGVLLVRKSTLLVEPSYSVRSESLQYEPQYQAKIGA